MSWPLKKQEIERQVEKIESLIANELDLIVAIRKSICEMTIADQSTADRLEKIEHRLSHLEQFLVRDLL